MNISIVVKGLAAVALIGACVLSVPVQAQKAKDTLRFPMSEAESMLDVYLVRGNFSQDWGPSVYDTLLDFNTKTDQFVGHLAKSWSQPDELSYEFELRDDLTWHDGEKVTADDVVYTINYLIDPNTQIRFKSTWEWVKSVEKLGPNKVRITSKAPVPDGLMFMAYGWPIYPKHLHAPLADKEAFGKRPIGTGPYKITKIDKNSGLVAEKFADYKPSSVKQAAAIGHVIAEPIPDSGTLVAALLTDKADVAENLPIDQVLALQQSGRFDVSLAPPGLGYSFLGFPSAGAKSVPALGDERVRTAIVKAIDRKALSEQRYGALHQGGVQPAESICLKEELGCGYTKMVPEYDPAGAKKLLAEAGYPDGFDVVLNTFPTNVPEATAISGMLRAVGIRATVNPHQIGLRPKLLSEGKVEMSYYAWTDVMFDVAPHVERHFLTDEFDDPTLVQLAKDTLTITDDSARRQAVAKVFDYSTEHAYALPMLPTIDTFTHTKEVRLATSGARTIAVNPHDFAWK